MARRLRPGHCFIALQSPEDTYSDVLDVLARHDVHLDRHTMINMYRVFLNTFHTMPVPSNVLPGHAQHPQATNTQNAVSSSPFSTVPATTKKSYEYPGLPKHGAPRDCSTSFYWSHTDPTFAVMLPHVDLTVYPNSSSSMKDAGEKAAEVRAAHICATKMAGADNLKQTTGHVAPAPASASASASASAPASEANMSSTADVNNSAAESQVSGDTQPTSQSIPAIEITDHSLDGTQATWTQETSTQGTSIFSQLHASEPSTQDTVHTDDSTQSSQPTNGPHPSGSTTRVKKTPVSVAHPRRSSPLAQSEPMVPDDVTLGKRSRDVNDSEPESGKKKSLTEADMAKMSTSKGDM